MGKAVGDIEEVTEVLAVVDGVEEALWGRLGVIPEAVVDVVIIIQLIMAHWHVTGAGCVAIWPVTVHRNLYSHREVVMLALPEEHLANPGRKAQEAEDVVVRSVSGA